MTDYSPGTVTSDLERVLQPNDTTAAPTPALRGGDGPNRFLPVVDTAPPPSMSHAEAVSRRDALISDAAFRDKLLAGDIDAKQEWNRIIAGLAYGQVPEPSAPNSVDGLADWALTIVPDLTEAHLEEIRTSADLSGYPAARRAVEGSPLSRSAICECLLRWRPRNSAPGFSSKHALVAASARMTHHRRE